MRMELTEALQVSSPCPIPTHQGHLGNWPLAPRTSESQELGLFPAGGIISPPLWEPFHVHAVPFHPQEPGIWDREMDLDLLAQGNPGAGQVSHLGCTGLAHRGGWAETC